jgi:hypothetical protein
MQDKRGETLFCATFFCETTFFFMQVSALIITILPISLPIASYCSADAVTSSLDKLDEETSVPLPLALPFEVIIPKKSLPDVLEVYDDNTLRVIRNKDKWGESLGLLEETLARYVPSFNPIIKFVRKDPVRILPSTLRPKR